MAKTDALVTFDYIVDQILLLSDDMPERYSSKLKQLAIRGYRELNLTTIPQGKVLEWMTLDSNYMILLDDDVVSVNDVFVPIDGMMWSLTRRKDIIPTYSIVGGAETLDSDRGEGVDIVPVEGVGLGASGGINREGYYYYDDRNRRLIFRNVKTLTEVLVDYNTTGVELTEQTYIPSYAEGAVTAYVKWQLEAFSSKPNGNVIAIWRDEYSKQKEICRAVQFNYTEFKDAIYNTFSMSFRRAD